MSTILSLLDKVHILVHNLVYNPCNTSTLNQNHFLTMKKNYTPPKIYSGGKSLDEIKKLSSDEKEALLKKSWYVYYSFRNPETNELKRMPNIKANASQFKTITNRFEYLNKLCCYLDLLLANGFNPYNEENSIEKYNDIIANNDKIKNIQIIKPIAKEVIKTKKVKLEKEITLLEAINFALTLKKTTLNEVSYKNTSLKVLRFANTFPKEKTLKSLTKKEVIEYFNAILINSSARNRNNARTDLLSIFNLLVDNEMIDNNVIATIKPLKTTPERNKTYTINEEEKLFLHLEQNDKLLLLYIKFISYNILRPVEVNRLRIKDINFDEKLIYVIAKNKKNKIKIIPDILLNDIPDLSSYNKENYIFTPTGIGNEWNVVDNQRRDYFSKRFSKIKTSLGFDKNYGLYSFRHTFITKLYRNIRSTKSQFEAKSMLMGITGHSTMDALEKYLRDIDAELADDYSDLIK